MFFIFEVLWNMKKRRKCTKCFKRRICKLHPPTSRYYSLKPYVDYSIMLQFPGYICDECWINMWDGIGRHNEKAGS